MDQDEGALLCVCVCVCGWKILREVGEDDCFAQPCCDGKKEAVVVLVVDGVVGLEKEGVLVVAEGVVFVW